MQITIQDEVSNHWSYSMTSEPCNTVFNHFSTGFMHQLLAIASDCLPKGASNGHLVIFLRTELLPLILFDIIEEKMGFPFNSIFQYNLHVSAGALVYGADWWLAWLHEKVS